MREIKFRGKTRPDGLSRTLTGVEMPNKQSGVKDNEWVYGFYFIEAIDNEYRFDYAPFVKIEYGDHFTDLEVIPETIGQYTGLKDKNGTEIYEGDIVVCGKRTETKGVVEYSQYSLLYSVNKSPLQHFVYNELDLENLEVDIEVIGNVYENPELLEEEE